MAKRLTSLIGATAITLAGVAGAFGLSGCGNNSEEVWNASIHGQPVQLYREGNDYKMYIGDKGRVFVKVRPGNGNGWTVLAGETEDAGGRKYFGKLSSYQSPADTVMDAYMDAKANSEGRSR